MYTSKLNLQAVIDSVRGLSDCSFDWSLWFKCCFNAEFINPENLPNFCGNENWFLSSASWDQHDL